MTLPDVLDCWSMIFSENQYPPRIKSGAGFFGIMLAARCGRARFWCCRNNIIVGAPTSNRRASIGRGKPRDDVGGNRPRLELCRVVLVDRRPYARLAAFHRQRVADPELMLHLEARAAK